MDTSALSGHTDERKLFQQFLGQFGGPAFVRRAREVQGAYDSLLATCRQRRDEWLEHVRLQLGTLFALAGSTAYLIEVLGSTERLAALEALHADLQPRLRLPVAPTANPRTLRRALTELTESIERFNRRWRTFIEELDLEKLNALRDGYNRYYVMEKECALGSVAIARQGFRKLEALRCDDVLKVLPPLPLP